MANDALVTSLCERVRALEDILEGIDQREQRTTALAVSVQQRVERNEEKIRGIARLAELVAQPENQAAEVGAPRHARPRDRHGLRLIQGGMAALAPLGVGLRWAARTKAHKAIMWAACATFATAAVTSSPVMAGAPGIPHPHAIVTVHRHQRRRSQSLPVMPPGPRLAAGGASRHRHLAADDDDVAVEPSPSPDPSPTVTSSPTPSPAPSASATGTGMPSPGGSPPAR